jgi:hypothetical protein
MTDLKVGSFQTLFIDVFFWHLPDWTFYRTGLSTITVQTSSWIFSGGGASFTKNFQQILLEIKAKVFKLVFINIFNSELSQIVQCKRKYST